MKNIAAVDLNLMTAFEAMMIEGNVTRAAARVGLAQPSMSNALARLRALFDDPLFVRTPVGMHPTEKAQAIAPLISSALADLHNALNASTIFDPAKSERTFRLATTDYVEFVILPQLMSSLRKMAPAIQLVSVPFDREKIANQLSRAEVDLAINVLPGMPGRIHKEKLLDEHFVCIARKSHPDIPDRLDLSTFLNLQHALVAPRGRPTGAVDRALEAIGKKRHVAMSVSNFISLPFLIADSDMVAVIGERVARRLADIIDLAVYEVPIDLRGFKLSMAWDNRTDRDEGQLWFRQMIRDCVHHLTTYH